MENLIDFEDAKTGDLLDLSDKENCRSETPAMMDNLTNNSLFDNCIKPIEEEEFDFNLPLTDQSDNNTSQDDDSEIFFGPQKFHEKVVAAAVEHQVNVNKPTFQELTDAEFDLIAKDAQLIVDELQEQKTAVGETVVSPVKKVNKVGLRCSPRLKLGRSPLVKVTPVKGPTPTKNNKNKTPQKTPKQKTPQKTPKQKEHIFNKFKIDWDALASPIDPVKKIDELPKGHLDTEDGIAKFEATVESSQLTKPQTRRSGLPGVTGAKSKEVQGTKLQRSQSLKGPGSKIGTLNGGLNSKMLPLLKKPRSNKSVSSDDMSDTMSVSSDVSSSSIHLPNGKRRLPELKLKLPKPNTTRRSLNTSVDKSLEKTQKAAPRRSDVTKPKSPVRPVIKTGQPASQKSGAAKAPISKLGLLKPGLSTRKPPMAASATKSRLVPPASKSTAKKSPNRQPLKAIHPANSVTKTEEKPASRRSLMPQLKPATPTKSNPTKSAPISRLESTPVKKEKNVQPKKITLETPKKESKEEVLVELGGTPGSLIKRRSMLPTPTKSRMSSVSSVASSRSSVSSAASLGSPLVSLKPVKKLQLLDFD